MTSATTSHIGSISKLCTAIMQLVEEGTGALDSAITAYIPEFSIKSRFVGI